MTDRVGIAIRIFLWLLSASFVVSGVRELLFPAGIMMGITLGIADWSTFTKAYYRLSQILRKD